ncbi:hydrogenase maturation protease [Candidatus Magnetominusculus dajiuhuensis]|uniref:hydrogenase maturation protease n=1 Tax=Candidatus Magnetominusculus dajiuhuensis TaxID=3137712 RepID=UPI003B4378C5
MKTIIIGLGNPILCDDSVGPRAARLIGQRLGAGYSPYNEDILVSEAYAGGLRLLDAIAGYDRAVIIDSIVTGENAPGTIYRLTADGLPQTRNCGSSHDMTLPMALSMGRALGMVLPFEIHIWAVEVQDVNTFGQWLSMDVENALSDVVNGVLSMCADCKVESLCV